MELRRTNLPASVTPILRRRRPGEARTAAAQSSGAKTARPEAIHKDKILGNYSMVAH